jgi:hypothetical protein
MDDYLQHLREELWAEDRWADDWLRWYFLGPYSRISQSHRDFINQIRRERGQVDTH